LHGRYTCVARKPLCPTCVVRDLCRFKDKTKEAELVKPKAPIPKKARHGRV
jgi:endonuclease-3